MRHPKNTFRVTGAVTLAEEGNTSTIEILRTGVIRDHNLKITPKMLSDFVKNFKANTYGVNLQVDYRHDREGEAAGWFRELYEKDGRLMATIEWTPEGAAKIKSKAYQYVSVEFKEMFTEPVGGKKVPNVLIGCALTNIPAMKHQEPIALSELINLSNSAMLKKLIAAKMARKGLLTEDDKAEVAAMLAEATDEQKEEVKADVVKFEERCAEDSKKPAKKDDKSGGDEDGEDEDEEGGEDAKDGKKKLKSKKASEKKEMTEADKGIVTTLSEEVTKLRAELDERKLSEFVEENVMLSEADGVSTGFNEADRDEVETFLSDLSAEKRTQFAALVGKIKSVDFTVRGADGESTLSEGGNSLEDKVIALTEKLMDEDKTLGVVDAQKKAADTLGFKKR